MENEKIYVVVPVYKVEAYIHRCIDSILNQTLADFQLILVDDGSPDNCGAICDAYAARDSRIHVIHQKNGGLSAARNTGIDYAFTNGNPEQDWITFIDSDDFVHPRYLEYLYRVAKASGTEISSCGFSRTSETTISSSRVIELTYEPLPPEIYWCKDYTNANVAWGKLYRIFLFENICYPIGKIFEDTFTTYKLLFQFEKIAVTDAKLYCWYINNESITMSEWSPKQIDLVDASEMQLTYLKTNGFKRASKRSAQNMLWGCVKCLKYIRRLSPKYDDYLKQMEARQKEAFRLYAEEAGLIMAVCYWLMVRYIAPAARRTKRAIRKILHAKK